MRLDSARCLSAFAGTALLALLGGCATGSSASSSQPVVSLPADEVEIARPNETSAERVARLYLVTPEKARQIGYRIDWQDAGTRGVSVATLSPSDDSVFALDAMRRISRIDRSRGSRLWRLPLLTSVQEVYGMTYLPADGTLHVAAGTEMQVLDGGTGVLMRRDKLSRPTSTGPTAFGRFLIYGSRDGTVNWHQFQVGTNWKSYRVAQSVELSPVVTDDGYVLVAGADGSISSLRGFDASRVWRKSALDDIVAPPAAGGGMAYASSLDQHIRAWPLGEDRRVPSWEYLTPAALVDGPTIVGNTVYQRVPGNGLFAFEARPADRPGGVLRWSASDVDGNVLGRRGDQLLVWNADRQELLMVDERVGAITERIELPGVTTIAVDGVDDADIFLGGTDGRVLRLVPTT
ncbi:MAG: PQQ-binding-like beta-propeller repeat protein [Phycisphaerales bacterium]